MIQINKIVLFVVLLGTFHSRADDSGSWTNLAGHVLKASPLSIQGRTVHFTLASGQTADYPLAVFLPSEQERLRYTVQEKSIPEGLKSAHEFAVRSITRSRLMAENGVISAVEFEQTCQAAIAAFRRQAVPLIEQKKISPERLELIIHEMVAPKK